MTNPSGNKGSETERWAVEYLRINGYPEAERRLPNGQHDRGDISGVRDWTLEVKGVASPDYGTFLKEARREQFNAGTRYGAVVHRPKGMGEASIASWRAVMRLEQLVQIMADLRGLK